MRFRDTAAYRRILLALSLATVGGIGYLAYRAVAPRASAAALLAQAEAAYAKGTADLPTNPAAAAVRFDEARLLALRGVDTLSTEGQGRRMSVPVERFAATNAELLYLQARGTRDREFARAAAAGTPLPTTHDTTTGEDFRNLLAVPDATARSEAVGAVLLAARLSVENPELVKDALRVHLSQPAVDWAAVEPLARAAVARRPDDSRALYALARYEYDQPLPRVPTPAAKKDRSRVEAALTHVRAAAAAGAPPWRTAGLEVAALRWLAADAGKRQKPNPEYEQAARRRVFDMADGVLARAAKGDALAPLTALDADGLLSAHTAAVELAAVDAGGPDGDPRAVPGTAAAVLTLAEKLAADPAAGPYLPDAAAAVLAAFRTAQPFAAAARGAEWPLFRGRLAAFLDTHPDAVKARPGLRVVQAELWTREAVAAQEQGDPDAAAGLAGDAIRFAEAGLALVPAGDRRADDFHSFLAQAKLVRRDKTAAVEAHVLPLRAAASPAMRAAAQLMDGTLAVRQGKLLVARRHLEPLTDGRPDHAHVGVRAAATLANVLLQLGDPVAALPQLGRVFDAYGRLSPADRAWIGREFPTADDLIAAQVAANLDAAVRRAAQYVRDHPGQAVPFDHIGPYERAAVGLLTSLHPPTAADRAGRVAHARYLTHTGRADEAKRRLARAADDYPDSVDVVRAEVPLLVGTGTDRYAAADQRVQRLIADRASAADPTAARDARLFWAEWLAGTNRADQAVAFLSDASLFPDANDQAVQRVRALAMVAAGRADDGRQVLELLPKEPLVSAVLIQGAAGRPARDAALTDAVDRYENSGPFRVYQAAVRLTDGDPAGAARQFAAALTYTQVTAAARAGLQHSLLAVIAADPAVGRSLAEAVIAEHPDDPTGYFTAAYAALRLNDIGEASDAWPREKTMHAALHRWEPAALAAGTARADATLVRAGFILDAGDPATARVMAERLVAVNPGHVPARLFLAALTAEFPNGGDPIANASKHLAAAAAARPDHPRLPGVTARLKEAAGDLSGAAVVYDRLLAKTPTDPHALAGKVRLAERANDPTAALAAARRWQSLRPDDPDAADQVIRLLARTGATADAVAAADALAQRVIDTATKAGGSVSEATHAVALRTALTLARGGATEPAAARVAAVLAAKPDSEPALLLAGDLAAARRQWDAALGFYQKVLAAKPWHPHAGNNVAWILADPKSDPHAALTVAAAVRNGPAGKPTAANRLPADFLDTLGVAYLKLNDPARLPEMRELFEPAVERYPHDPRLRYYLGVAQAGLNETSKAMRTLDEAVRLCDAPPPGPSLPDAKRKQIGAAARQARTRLDG